MYCQNCGKEISGEETFCPSCGTRISGPAPAPSTAPDYKPAAPKDPSALLPFVLGMFLGVLGLIIAVLVAALIYNDGPYTKNPVIHALVWSLLGMLIWIPIVICLGIFFAAIN